MTLTNIVTPLTCSYVYCTAMYIHECMCIILVVVNYEPKKIYERFEGKLRDSLPTKQSEFIKLLEREDLINEKNREETPDWNTDVYTDACPAWILEEIDTTPFPDEKFRRLLSVMKKFNHGLETLAQEIEAHLDPGINA